MLKLHKKVPMKKIIFIITVIFLLNSCGAVHYNSLLTPKDSTKISKLEKELLTVSNNQKEAHKLAIIAIKTPRALANRYNLVSPPLYHNFLVNSGQRSRGLCYHFVEDTMAEINKYNFSSFKFRWGRANANKFNEHNVIVVTGNKDSNFSNGIILDGWRNSGELFFCKVKDDPKYKFIEWQEGNERIKK